MVLKPVHGAGVFYHSDEPIGGLRGDFAPDSPEASALQARFPRLGGAHFALTNGYTAREVESFVLGVEAYERKLAGRFNLPVEEVALGAISFQSIGSSRESKLALLGGGKTLSVDPRNIKPEELLGGLDSHLAHEIGGHMLIVRRSFLEGSLPPAQKAFAGSWAPHQWSSDEAVTRLVVESIFSGGLNHPLFAGLRMDAPVGNAPFLEYRDLGMERKFEFDLSEIIAKKIEFLLVEDRRSMVASDEVILRDSLETLASREKPFPDVAFYSVWARKLGLTDIADKIDGHTMRWPERNQEAHRDLCEVYGRMWDQVGLKER